MAATLDKDTLVKHSFWILAGGYLVLVLGCLAVLATSVSDTVRKEADELKKAQELVQAIKDPKNERVVEAYKKQDELVKGTKNEVWKKAWETQKDIMTWPHALEAKFQKYKYFGDPIDTYDRSEFKQHYPDQFQELWEVVQPVLSNGEGVVQCKGGDWAAVLQLDKSFSDPPSKDDIWLAQEELWVKREMLRIIREANQYVARFKEVAPESPAGKERKAVIAGPAAEKVAQAAKPETAAGLKPPPQPQPGAGARTDSNHKIFRNPYWQFDLTLAEQARGKYVLRGKITNVAQRKQPLDAKFKVLLQDPRAVADPSFQQIALASLPLAVGESKEVNQPVEATKAIEGLFGVEQVLNWKTAAVKRLDELRLMYPSSRTAVRTLKPPRFINPNPPEGDSSASGDAGSQTAGGSTAGAAGGPAGYGVPAPQAAITTLSGLEINRYTDVSEPVRHMPVAMVVVVDEEHLPELLAAFVNSKLRIQVTQYHWHHCRDRMNPQLNSEGAPPYTPGGASFMGRGERSFIGPVGRGTIGGKAYGVRPDYPGRSGDRARPGAPGVPYNVPGRPLPGGPGPIRSSPPDAGAARLPVSSGPIGSGSVSEEDEEQEDLNLVEVAVYGLASLYERYPPKPAEPGSSEEKKAEAGSTDGK